MDGISVVIESKTATEITTSCSGIRMGSSFILTHCCIVWSIVEEFFKNKALTATNIIGNSQQNLLTNYLKNLDLQYKVYMKPQSIDSRFSKDIDRNLIKCVDATLKHVLIPPKLFKSLLQLLSKDKWNFIPNKNEDKPLLLKKDGKQKSFCKTNALIDEAVFDSLYLSTFLILKINDGDLLTCIEKFEKITSVPNKGDYILLEGSPFGSNAPALLLNSISQGIIGNMVPDGNFFITDARCSVGCEGGPAYSGSKLAVCGITLSPSCTLSGSWVGLTFAASIRPILAYLKKCISEQDYRPTEEFSNPRTNEILYRNPHLHEANSNIISNVVKLMELCIVRIFVKDRKGYSWGSGVVVNAKEGLIISCAHVVKDAIDKKVEVCLSNGTELTGTILYQSDIELDEKFYLCDSNANAWDLSVIRMSKPFIYSLTLAEELPTVGTSVLNGGYSLFWKDSLISPTFSLGNIAKTMELPRSHFNCDKWIGNRSDIESKTNTFKKPSSLEANRIGLTSCPVDSKIETVIGMSDNKHNININPNLVCHKWKDYNFLSSSFPVMLQTTCAVYNGLSGGPVVAIHPSKGPMVIGIVTCCVLSKEDDILFPHINMAVPSFFISKAVKNYVSTKDPDAFKILNINSPTAVNLTSFKHNVVAKL